MTIYRDEFGEWATQQGYSNASKMRAGARAAWIARQGKINSLMGKFGAASKQNYALKNRVTSLEAEVKRLRAERDAAIEAMEP